MQRYKRNSRLLFFLSTMVFLIFFTAGCVTADTEIDIGMSEEYSENAHTVYAHDTKKIDIMLGESSEDTEAASEVFEFVDYISLTNATETVESTKLREGDEFLGLVLEEIISLPEDPTIILGVRFSGEMVVRGDFVCYWLNTSETVIYSFDVHKDYVHLFPAIADFGSQISLAMTNEEEILRKLDVRISKEHCLDEYYHDEDYNILLENATVRVDDFIISFHGRANYAKIIEIIMTEKVIK